MNQAHVKLASLPLAALRAFEAAYRLGSFRDAAAEVGLTPSAVSHHVRQLEAGLGTTLFLRLHRKVIVTPAGAELGAGLGRGFAALAAAYATAQAPRGPLVVSAAPEFAVRWLMPAAKALEAEGMTLRIEASARRADIAAGECDVAIRLGPRPVSQLASERLATSPVVLLGAPARLAGRPALAPEEIAAGPLLGLSLRPKFWTEVLARLEQPASPRAETMFDSLDAALRAAEAGHGFIYAPEMLVADHITSGRLALVHPRRFGARTAWSYWFTTRPESFDQRAIRRLREWLRAALSSKAGPALGVAGAEARCTRTDIEAP
jgi:LysR family glycine cleavage system transcriptional activator